MSTEHPIQNIVTDAQGVERFEKNRLVQQLLDVATATGFGLNELHAFGFGLEDIDRDRRQLAQLIGYSVSGYGSLSYVRDQDFDAACAKRDGRPEDEARIAALQEQVEALESALERIQRIAGDPRS